MAERMPALFIGHGNPMNALLVNPYTQRWSAIGAALPKPKAILSVSAHWYIEDAAVTVSTAPRTIHDFGGFPRELYQVQYPAPGDPELAMRIQKLLAPVPAIDALNRKCERFGLYARAGHVKQWRSDTEPDLLNDAIFGAIYYRFLLGSGPLTKRFGEELIEQVIRGQRSGNARS
jgi:Catalytic LigB subunit of aromatic ring-opening dioxygenase